MQKNLFQSNIMLPTVPKVVFTKQGSFSNLSSLWRNISNSQGIRPRWPRLRIGYDIACSRQLSSFAESPKLPIGQLG
jgi:hypothetical protein